MELGFSESVQKSYEGCVNMESECLLRRMGLDQSCYNEVAFMTKPDAAQQREDLYTMIQLWLGYTLRQNLTSFSTFSDVVTIGTLI